MSDEHHITLRYRVYTINSFGNSQWKKILVVLLLVTEYLFHNQIQNQHRFDFLEF